MWVYFVNANCWLYFNQFFKFLLSVHEIKESFKKNKLTMEKKNKQKLKK